MSGFTLSHSDRFKWHIDMLESDLDPTAKAVLSWIFANLDKTTGRVARHQDTIATKMQMKKATLRAALARAKKAGWVTWEGAGGIAYDIDGRRRGLACVYAMAIPANQIARYSNTCENEAANVLTKPAIRANEAALTCEPVSTNTLSSSLSSHMYIPEPAGAGNVAMKEEEEASLPTASAKDRFGWEGFWIDTPTVVAKPSSPSVSSDFIIARIQDLLLAMLGWRPADRRDIWQALSTQLACLDRDMMSELVKRYRDGILTDLDLANVLASSGITPPARVAVEADTNAA